MKMTMRLKPNASGAYGISGVGSDVAKMFLLNHLVSPKIEGEIVFWLVKNPAEANALESYYQLWSQNKQKFPILTPDENNYPLIFWRIMNKQPGIIFIPLELLTEPIITPKLFLDKILKIKVNSRYSPGELSQQLVLIGYEYNTTADAPGRFARRGNILDVFPPQSNHPIRFEFGQTEIISLKTYNELNGRTITSHDDTIIIPCQIGQYEATGRWMEYLKPINHVKATFICSDPDELENITPYWSELIELMRDQTKIVFYPLPTSAAKNYFDFSAANIYHRDFHQLIKDIQKWQADKFTIYASNSFKTDFNRFWKKQTKDYSCPIKYLPSAYFEKETRGFISKQNKVVLLTEFEIIGYKGREPKIKKKRFDLDFIAELKAGDLVVHLDHGIGRFRGLVTNVIDGIIKEYFQLEYAAGDKLSVPVELAYKIDKYVGSVVPKIHRLSNTSWRRMTQKIKQEAKKMAKDLLKLYAQRETIKIEPFQPTTQPEKELAKSFPYQETPDQHRTIQEVIDDMESDEPMDRLVCGDVGFGKTEVAIRAAYKAVMNGRQVVVLAPTTILAQQHYDTFTERLKRFNLNIDSLSRFKSRAEQLETVAKLKTGEIDIVIGTHRLLSSDVSFKNLGIIIIDEEQRFGVQHKEKLKSLRVNAHILTLTATPIPRTLNFSLSSLRDMSVIRTAPEGRQPIETIIKPYREDTVRNAINLELKRDGQVYYLYNRVETINLKADQLKKLIPKAKIGIIHGQLPEDQLAETMSRFDNQKINVLISTTIIENGLDLPNVNTMVIEDATRFGLAQLYQLRGRIGRGHRQAYSYFFYPQKKLTGEAKKRLQAILEAKELGSGFQLALRDLEIRGVGNILGREQHGRVNAIGLSLYSRLLSQAVEELRTGKPVKQLRDISIDLPLPITLPHDYITQENQRLKVYRDLSDATEKDDLKERVRAVEKRHGPAPPNLIHLHRLLQIKLDAQDTAISSIDTVHATDGNIVKSRLVIKFNEIYRPEQIKKLLELNSNWVLGENQIKIDFEALGKKWLPEIEKTVRIFIITA